MLPTRSIEQVVSKITIRQFSKSTARPPNSAPPNGGKKYEPTRYRRISTSQNASRAATATAETEQYNKTNAFITLPKEVHDRLPKGGDITHQPIAIKDNICTKDYPTTCASAILKDFHSPYDATVVRLLREAGARIHGKTNMDEFGMGSHSIQSHFGAVISPERVSVGGSSGGSALVVSNGQAWA